jgi:uncharacterized lipoprotein YehR (DUF1307 family)
MKNFKKIFTLIFVLLLAVVLVGCTDKQAEADKALLEETADKLHISGASEVMADLKLSKYVVGDKREGHIIAYEKFKQLLKYMILQYLIQGPRSHKGIRGNLNG